MKRTTVKNYQGGFSVIEMIFAFFILTIIGIIIANFQSDIFSLNKMASNKLDVQEEINRAFKVMTTEIRSMSLSNKGSYPLIKVSTSTLIFYNDINKDSRKEKIRYFIDKNILKRGVTESTGNFDVYDPKKETITELAHGLVNNTTAIFTYYDSNYDGVSPPLIEPINISLVRLVKINIEIDSDPSGGSATPLALTTQISIRNLKDNL
jgi:hypothetical protein